MAEKCKCPPRGAPGWIVTFADLMSILLTFFILILSFSVQDEEKYYDLVGSVREAFGTQNELILAGMVELFGNPYNDFAVTMTPVPIATISLPDVGAGAGYGDQPTDDDVTLGNPAAPREDMPSAPMAELTEELPPEALDGDTPIALLTDPEAMFSEEALFAIPDGVDIEATTEAATDMDGPAPAQPLDAPAEPSPEIEAARLAEAVEREIARRESEAEQAALLRSDQIREELAAALANELEGDVLSIDGNKTEITIRFPDTVAFGSGSDILKDSIGPALERVAEVLAATDGQILVSGHTDSIPISNGRFRSNWDLSTARAVSVIHRLKEAGAIELSRMAAVGYADTRPLAAETSPENRALNRRVEVTLRVVELPPADGDNTIP